MPKLVNLGSLCIDYVYTVKHIAQPGETVASSAMDIFAGGKGLNQSIAASCAGATVHHYGAVGEDGQLLIDTLKQHNVDVHGVQVLADPSGHANIQVNSTGQNAIVIHGGANRSFDHGVVDDALAAVGEGDWLLLQNEISHLAPIVEQAAARGLKVALNLAPVDERIVDYPYRQLALLVVNEQEARAVSGQANGLAAFQFLRAEYPQTHLIVTLGIDGALAYDASDERCWTVGSYRVDAIDETAAGDAYVGYLLAALVQNRTLTDGLESAAAAGALAVTKAGAAPSIPTLQTVNGLLSRQTLSLREMSNP